MSKYRFGRLIETWLPVPLGQVASLYSLQYDLDWVLLATQSSFSCFGWNPALTSSQGSKPKLVIFPHWLIPM